MELAELDAVLSQHAYTNEDTVRHPGTISFQYISRTFLNTYNAVYSSIMRDGVISDRELAYIIRLRDDIDTLVENLSAPDDPLNANYDLRMHQVNYYFNEFYATWASMNSEDNPYLLLRDE